MRWVLGGLTLTVAAAGLVGFGLVKLAVLFAEATEIGLEDLS